MAISHVSRKTAVEKCRCAKAPGQCSKERQSRRSARKIAPKVGHARASPQVVADVGCRCISARARVFAADLGSCDEQNACWSSTCSTFPDRRGMPARRFSTSACGDRTDGLKNPLSRTVATDAEGVDSTTRRVAARSARSKVTSARRCCKERAASEAQYFKAIE